MAISSYNTTPALNEKIGTVSLREGMSRPEDWQPATRELMADIRTFSNAVDAHALTIADHTTSVAGHLFGLTLSNNAADATNDIDIAAGSARDATNAVVMVRAATLTKRLDAAWAVGSGNGGLDTGSIADTTYHVWLIKRSDTGVVDALFSASATAPTMPASYTHKRRIGSIIRTGGLITLFTQYGDRFIRNSQVLDVNVTNPGTAAVTRTLSVPTGLQYDALTLLFVYTASATARSVLLSSFDQTDQAPSGFIYTGRVEPIANFNSVAFAQVRTNTSAQIRSRLDVSDASAFVRLQTLGWVDTRGRVA